MAKYDAKSMTLNYLKEQCTVNSLKSYGTKALLAALLNEYFSSTLLNILNTLLYNSIEIFIL